MEEMVLETLDECTKIIKTVKMAEKCESPILTQLQQHLQDLFSTGDNNQIIESSLGNIGLSAVRDMICFNIWNRKGRVEGVHPDFGRLSYIRSQKISGHYHANDDERVELILDLTDKLNNVD